MQFRKKSIFHGKVATLLSGRKLAFSFLALILLVLPLMIILVTQRTHDQQHTAAANNLLTWAPPTCGDATHGCVDLYLNNTGSNQNPSLSASNDYRIHLPNVPLQGGLQITGGHNVIIIGGEIDLTVPCSDSSSACHGINISRSNAGQVFIEGVWLHNPTTIPSSCATSGMPCSTGDGVDVDAAPGPVDVTMENVRIDGISGCSGGSDHADVFQPYNAGNAKLHVDHLTGITNCQGMTVDPDYALTTYGTMPMEGIYKNVNINVIPNPYSGNNNRYTWWFTYYPSSGPTCTTYPITLTNDYAQEPNGSLQLNSVWPDTNSSFGCPANYQNGIATWPNITNISGGINNGLPAAGDFVPVGAAGIGYVSPGYVGSATPTTAGSPTNTPTPTPIASGAGVGFDAQNSTNTSASSTSLTWSHTTGSQANRILLVGVALPSTTNSVTSVTYNGANLTRLATQNSGTTVRDELWYLPNPPSGSYNVVVTINGSAYFSAGSASFYNVDPTTPFGTTATNSGNGTTASVTAANTTVNQLVMDVLAGDGVNLWSADSSQTVTWNNQTHNATAGSYKTGMTGNTTMTWTNPSTSIWAEIGLPLNAAGVTPSPTPTPMPTNTPTPMNTPTPTPSPVNPNLIQNSSFENTGSNWLSPWLFQVRSPAAAKISQNSTYHEDGKYSADVTVSKSSSTDWYVQLLQHNLSLVAGKSYTFSFWARAGSKRTMYVVVQNYSGNNGTLYFGKQISVTTSWQNYIFTFTAPSTDTDAYVGFNLANYTGNDFIDKVSLTQN